MAARRGIAVFTVAQSLAFSQLAEAYAGFILHRNRLKFPHDTNLTQDWAKPYGPTEVDAGTVLEGSIEDQAGKFNLNSLVMQPNPGGPLVVNNAAVSEFRTLLESLDIDVKYVARLVDWLDSDDQPTSAGGAEDSYYLAQDPPYRTLNMTLTSALVVDWRKQPFFRSLMRLPWSMTHSNVVRMNIDPFDHPPDEIHRTLTRMWRHYRS